MRVLMISKACVVGSYQKKLEELAKFPDLELFVVVPPYWREGRSRIPLERAYLTGYQLIIEPMAFNGHFHVHFYPFLGRRMRQIAPDIVHVDEEPYNLATFQAIYLARQRHVRALFFTWQNLRRSYPFPFAAFERYNLAHVNYALAGNAEAAGILRDKGYKGPLEVIPQFGVDPESYRPFREEDREAQGPFVIGYVGRLVPEKGVDILLNAAARLEGDWRLEIIGEGPERRTLQRLASDLRISPRVFFRGRIPSTEMPSYLNYLDVLVLPSRTRPNWKEQFGRILVEAMACEVPVIGSNCGEIPHVIGDAGLTFPEGDIEALQRCLTTLMLDPGARQALGKRGRHRVLTHYTQARVAERTYQVYRQLVL